MSIPEKTGASVETIRGFFRAYLSHKYYVDHLINLNASKLIERNWLYQEKVVNHNVYEKLLQLQNVLNFHVQNLFLLVRIILTFDQYVINISLQLNNTCNACMGNCPQSSIVNTTRIINTMEDCGSPVYNVIDIIAKHSKKLFKIVENLKDVAVNELKNDDSIITDVSNINYGSCLCNNSTLTE